jgi:hypothetical protein
MMKKTCFLILVLVSMGSIPAMGFSEDVFAPVRKVYMVDGKIIECQMGWLDGARMICRKFGGNVILPLQSVDIEKTFPKYKNPDGETIYLVHPGTGYQDENIIISNLRLVHRAESHSRNSCLVVCEIMNRGDPCEVRVVVNTLDTQGKVLQQIDLFAEARLDTGELTVLKRWLDRPTAGLESQVSFLKVSHVERTNVVESPTDGRKVEHKATGSVADRSKDEVRDEKIRTLKETFLKERPLSP